MQLIHKYYSHIMEKWYNSPHKSLQNFPFKKGNSHEYNGRSINSCKQTIITKI